MNDALLITTKSEKKRELIDLVRWYSRSKKEEVKINENVSKDSLAFTITNPRSPLSHTFTPKSVEERNEWISEIKSLVKITLEGSSNRLALLKNNSELGDECTKEHLEGMVFSIPSAVPVGSSSEKHFTAYMIDMSNENGNVTILKRFF